MYFVQQTINLFWKNLNISKNTFLIRPRRSIEFNKKITIIHWSNEIFFKCMRSIIYFAYCSTRIVYKESMHSSWYTRGLFGSKQWQSFYRTKNLDRDQKNPHASYALRLHLMYLLYKFMQKNIRNNWLIVLLWNKIHMRKKAVEYPLIAWNTRLRKCCKT